MKEYTSGNREVQQLSKRHYFLAKTDPETYDFEQLERDGQTVWDGVTNAQALRAIREMKAGDRVFIYHSMGKAAIVGLADIVGDGRSDPANFVFTRESTRPSRCRKSKATGPSPTGLW